MGTDVYLKWDNMTEEDKEAQITGFSIEAGSKGYLRASIGMRKENAVLRELFPNCWSATKEYDFLDEDNQKKLDFLAKGYILSIIMDKDVRSEEHRKTEEMGEAIASLFKGNAYKVYFPQSKDFRGGIVWLNSLYAFYELGVEKQKEGKNPKICISW